MATAGNNVQLTDDLCELFGDALDKCRIIMFSAPAGCGKTTQSRALLRRHEIPFREYDAGQDKLVDHIKVDLASFACHPDEPTQTHPPRAVLVDNLRHLTDGIEQRALANLIATSPSTLFVLCGRCPLPSWLSHFEAALVTLTIEAEDLVFDEDSLQRLLSSYDLELTADETHEILARTVGYPSMVINSLELLHQQVARGHEPTIDDELFEHASLRFFGFCRVQVFNEIPPEGRHLLLCVAPFDTFDDELAVALTGNPDAPMIVSGLLANTRMFNTNSIGTLSLWPAFRSFLLWEARRKWTSQQRTSLYERAAHHFEEEGDLVPAIKCYSLCDDRAKVVSLLSRHSKKNPRLGSYRELAPFYLSLTDDEARTSPDLMSGLSMLEMLVGNYEESNRWYDELASYTKADSTTPQLRKVARSDLYYLDIALPQRDSGQDVALLALIAKALASGMLDRESFSFSVTSGLPSILSGGRDYSEWVKQDHLLYNTMSMPIVHLLGRDGIGLPRCALDESLFEKGEDVSGDILNLASSIPTVRLKGTPDIEFAIVGLLARVHVDRECPDEARSIVMDLRKSLVKRNERVFLPNVDALLARIALYQGDRPYWERWLRTEAPPQTLSPYAMDRYLYQTLMLAQLAKGDNEQVLLTSAPWRTIFESCHRFLDLIDLRVVTAIALYRVEQGRGAHAAQETSWQEELSAALDSAYGFGYIRPLSHYGIAVLPLLQQSTWSGDQKYLKRVISATRLQATYYPQFLQVPSRLLEPLTPSEHKVLKLLANDLSNAKIGEILDIKLPTVKSHVSHIMQKLDVSSRAQVKTVAHEIGLV